MDARGNATELGSFGGGRPRLVGGGVSSAPGGAGPRPSGRAPRTTVRGRPALQRRGASAGEPSQSSGPARHAGQGAPCAKRRAQRQGATAPCREGGRPRAKRRAARPTELGAPYDRGDARSASGGRRTDPAPQRPAGVPREWHEPLWGECRAGRRAAGPEASAVARRALRSPEGVLASRSSSPLVVVSVGYVGRSRRGPGRVVVGVVA
jgi:hypothetical protein